MILGISLAHNATACLVDPTSGEVLFCSSEERYTRRKQEWGFPLSATEAALKQVGDIGDIQCVAVGGSYNQRCGGPEITTLINLDPYSVRDAVITNPLTLARMVLRDTVLTAFKSPRSLNSLVRDRIATHLPGVMISFHDHHAAHAAGAYFGSRFDEALVVTLDGEGDDAMGSVWKARQGTLIERQRYPDTMSIGLFYKAITSLLGFRVNQDEGKVTALAAHGNPERFTVPLRAWLGLETDKGALSLNSKAARSLTDRWRREAFRPLTAFRHAIRVFHCTGWDELWNTILQEECEQLFAPLNLPNREERTFQLRADLAAAAQVVFTEAAMAILRQAQQVSNCKNLVVAGGVFANVSLNGTIVSSGDWEGFHVHPGMGDEGLAIGAALLTSHEWTSTKLRRSSLSHVFLGDEAISAGESLPLSARAIWRPENVDGLVQRAVQALMCHQVVAVCRGRMEYGPRALGNRSILAHPAQPNLHSELNRRLERSELMPFAPAVLDSEFSEVFDSTNVASDAARFMTIALPVRKEWQTRVAGVVHRDGSARPQRVLQSDQPFLYAVLREFHKATGLPCVVNTSLNMHGDPIVRSLDEAVQVFDKGAVDLLISEEHYLSATAELLAS